MKNIKKYIVPTLIIILFAFMILNIDKISNRVANLLEKDPAVIIKSENEFAKDYGFKYVQIAVDYKPYSYQDLLNIYFTIINNGWNEFTFYCPSEYIECLDDVKNISVDDNLLTHINNFVHPYNSFNSIKTTYYENGQVNLEIEHLYSKEDIQLINNFVDKTLGNLFEEDMTDEEKLREVHDYIINNADYDVQKNKTGDSPYNSNKATGVLFEGYGICSGFSDTYAIFLDKMDIKNFKVASETHVWNAVYINNDWYNVDITWDNPVSEDGKKNLWHKYFLIKTEKFKTLDKEDDLDHIFDKSIYLEVK